jgi:exonuclease-1
MGIKGLPQYLKANGKHVDVYKNHRRIGVDVSVWLYQAVYKFGIDVFCDHDHKGAVGHVLQSLLDIVSAGGVPFVVFDGKPLPAKARTATQRRFSHAVKVAKYEAAADAANPLKGGGREAWRDSECSIPADVRELVAKRARACAKVTPSMARELMALLRLHHIPYVVAPFEADAQLAFLARHGYVDLIATSDSDLAVYGTCDLVLGFCPSRSRTGLVTSRSALRQDATWARVVDRPLAFERCCILSGCDYGTGVRGIGIKRAAQVLADPDCDPTSWGSVLACVRKAFRFAETGATTAVKLADAEFVFRHQYVWDPRTETQRPNTPIEAGTGTRPDLVGDRDCDPRTARAHARGELVHTYVHAYEPVPDPEPERFGKALVQLLEDKPAMVAKPEEVAQSAVRTGPDLGTVVVATQGAGIAGEVVQEGAATRPEPEGVVSTRLGEGTDVSPRPEPEADVVTNSLINPRKRVCVHDPESNLGTKRIKATHGH